MTLDLEFIETYVLAPKRFLTAIEHGVIVLLITQMVRMVKLFLGRSTLEISNKSLSWNHISSRIRGWS